LVAVVAGGLWMLLHWGQLGALSAVDWRGVWSRPDDGLLLLGILTAAGWLAWLLVVGTVLCEAVAALSRGRWRPRLPGAGWLRPAVAGLVVTVLGLSAASSLFGHQSLGAAVGGVGDGSTQRGPVSAGQADASVTAPASVVAAAVPYVVQPGDDLWSLAEQFAGGGENWRVIAAANDTVVLDPGVELTPGTMLMVPQPGASVTLLRATPERIDRGPSTDAGVEASGEDGVVGADAGGAAAVTVQRGDTLWGLSEDNLGDATRWPEIYDANRATISDPNLIYPGQTILLPGTGQPVDDTNDLGAGAAEETPSETPAGAVTPAEVPLQVEDPVENSDQADTSGESGVTDEQLSDEFSYAAQIGAGAGEVTATTATAPVAVSDGESSTVGNATSPASMVSALLGSIGVGLAAALLAGLGISRLMQLRERGVGRALPRMTPGMQEFETALDRRARNLLGNSDEDDDAIRPVVPRREFIDAGQIADDDAGPCDNEVQMPTLRLLDDDCVVGPVNGTVSLGVSAVGDDVPLDLLDAGLVQIVGPLPQVHGLMAAMAGQVLGRPAEERPEVMLAASNLSWLAALLDSPLMPSDVAESLVSYRLAADDVATEQLVVFTDGYMPTVGKGCGITIVSCSDVDRRPDADIAIEVDDSDNARLWQGATPWPGEVGQMFQAQLVSPPARRTLVELADTVTSLDFPEAPWWASKDEALPAGGDGWLPGAGASEFETPIDTGRLDTSPDVFALDDALAHPVLRLFGPVMLTGARGVVPSQAIKQCLEYCGWLLRNPGQTSATMAKSMLVVESTRRSNMSRLRLWLGCDDAGEPYLPDAYSGRIMLHEGVTSDWDRMNTLVGGVNRASEHSLIDALRLVRGAPLADAAPGQWRWAEEWRCDMVSLARDIAAVLCDRALARGDIELARWALGRGLLAAPDDVVLLTSQVQIAKLAGNRAEVERLATRLTQQASRAGFDLPAKTTVVLQEAIEGTPRLRAAA